MDIAFPAPGRKQMSAITSGASMCGPPPDNLDSPRSQKTVSDRLLRWHSGGIASYRGVPQIYEMQFQDADDGSDVLKSKHLQYHVLHLKRRRGTTAATFQALG